MYIVCSLQYVVCSATGTRCSGKHSCSQKECSQMRQHVHWCDSGESCFKSLPVDLAQWQFCVLLFCQLSSSFLNSLAFEFPVFCIRICFLSFFSHFLHFFPHFFFACLREKLHRNLPNMSHFAKHCRQIGAFLLRSLCRKPVDYLRLGLLVLQP